MNVDRENERTRSALTTLSTVGAAVAGLGFGVLLAPFLLKIAWAIVAVGVVSHLIGMVGVRQQLVSGGYMPSARQSAAYWLCWATIVVVAIAALWGAAR